MPGLDTQKSQIKPYTLESALIAYRACKTGSVTGAVVAIAAATDKVKGFAVEAGAIGENHGIAEDSGHVYAEAGAAIVADSFVTIDSVGRIVTAAPGAGTNVEVVGKALEPASAAGDIVPMQMTRFVMQG
jgi:hypothetical protein